MFAMLFSKDMTADSPLRQDICDNYIANEAGVIKELLSQLQLSEEDRNHIASHARRLITRIRKQQSNTTIDAIFNEYKLASAEGHALMCLAEAMLRVPDKQTAIDLITNKLTTADWRSHIGRADSIFINLLSIHLYIAANIMSYRNDATWLKRIFAICMTPIVYKLVREFIQRMARQFVLSQTIGGALQNSEKLIKKNYCFSYDMLGESARCKQDEQRFFQQYRDAIKAVGEQNQGDDIHAKPSISVKLSALHSRYCFSQKDRVYLELIPRLKQLALLAKSYNIALTIDAEESTRLELSLEIFKTLYLDADLAQWQGFGLAVQAYQKRAVAVIDWLIDLSINNKRQIPIRLVKGAYWDSEIKWAQEKGLADYPVFTTKAATDVSYLVCAQKLLNARPYIYPQFATHNAYTVASILQMDSSGDGVEFQRLHQMGQAFYDHLLRQKQVKCRVYAPVGKHVDLLAYLVRRMLENGANSSFVNNIVDDQITIDELLVDPVTILQQQLKPSDIPLAKDLYQTEFRPSRLNSQGIELCDKNALINLKSTITPILTSRLNVLPPTADLLIHNPAELQEIVGGIVVDTTASLEQKMQRSLQAFPVWSNVEISQRCEYLNLLADKLEDNQAELVALCIKEAGKTVNDSLSEVREAVDFCRYYACLATQQFSSDSVKSRGIVLCISPWNFPLAIFVGQVAAVLVTGNTVLAKAAEQTSLIAQRIVELIYETGIAKETIQLVLGAGMPIGKRLIPDERIQGVMFTGSCETATWINCALAKRVHNDIPFIAETGGQNTMIVDSTAQLEQLVDDVIQSGFYSAGQRCSSLRVLFVQDDIAEPLIELLKGAMAELNIADPKWLNSDIGPIIDKKSLDLLHQHCDFLERHQLDKVRLLYCCHLDENLAGGYYFAPRLYEINSIDLLEREVFGPILHLVRYQAGDLDNVIQQINNCGYGLTLGIHSRLQSVADYLASHINVGNVYVNRSMVGATVGVQPFGGRGLSGTGPKAGGPHYLEPLVTTIEEKPSVVLTLPKQIEYKTDEDILNKTKQAWSTWSQYALSDRINILKQLCGELVKADSSLETVSDDWLLAIQNMELKLNTTTQLPGPTGENNVLVYESSGVIVSVGHEEHALSDWFSIVISSLSAGNVVVMALPETDKELLLLIQKCMNLSKMPQHCLQFITDKSVSHLLNDKLVSAVISPVHNHQLKQLLSQRKGPIIPLLCVDDLFIENRLLLEKTISTDSTAAIGNTLLLSQRKSNNSGMIA
jgi:RHH-type transcriptional regulator, proline utilization regulon repressor / proline dehydrogenase / delta 1-pyrroline-5-carboxylate dehydrogenase